MKLLRVLTALSLTLGWIPATSACGGDFDAMFPSVHVVAATRRFPTAKMSRRTLRTIIHAVHEMEIKPYATMQSAIAEL